MSTYIADITKTIYIFIFKVKIISDKQVSENKLLKPLNASLNILFYCYFRSAFLPSTALVPTLRCELWQGLIWSYPFCS